MRPANLRCGHSSRLLASESGSLGRLVLEDGSPGIDRRKLECTCRCEASHLCSPNAQYRGFGELKDCSRRRCSKLASRLQRNKLGIMVG